MAWTTSKVFVQTVADLFENATAMDYGADTFKAALFDNTIVPDETVAAASTAYGAGVWLTGPEVEDTTEWDAGGEPLASSAISVATATMKFDATDTQSGGTSATLAAVHGCLVYDETIATPVANQGACFNWFGGENSVTNGTFTVAWHANGIFTVAC